MSYIRSRQLDPDNPESPYMECVSCNATPDRVIDVGLCISFCVCRMCAVEMADHMRDEPNLISTAIKEVEKR